MVRFKENRFTIEVEDPNPVDRWLNIYEDILSLCQDQSENMMYKHYFVFDLLKEMMPDCNIAKKMK